MKKTYKADIKLTEKEVKDAVVLYLSQNGISTSENNVNFSLKYVEGESRQLGGDLYVGSLRQEIVCEVSDAIEKNVAPINIDCSCFIDLC